MEAPDDRARRMRTSADARDAVGEMLDTTVQIDAMIAGLTAMRFEVVDQAQRLAILIDPATRTDADMSRRAFRAELACALLIPESTADRLTSDAETLVNHLQATLTALREGRIRERHARILVDQLGDLDADDRVAIERIALPLAANR